MIYKVVNKKVSLGIQCSNTNPTISMATNNPSFYHSLEAVPFACTK